MKITRIKEIGRSKTLQMLSGVRLIGHSQTPVYKNARLELIHKVDPRTLVPTQRYVLTENLEMVGILRKSLEKFSVDIFSLDGCVEFWKEPGNRPLGVILERGPISLLPPIVEAGEGGQVSIINDGMHRIMAAIKAKRLINIILVRDIPPKYPYYAFSLVGGWSDVQELSSLPKGFVKKFYRDPKNHRDLIRDFNPIFPGIQRKRLAAYEENI
jgi:hypothetical protein